MKIGRPVVGIRRAIYSMRAAVLGVCIDYCTELSQACNEWGLALQARAENLGYHYRAAKRRARGGQ